MLYTSTMIYTIVGIITERMLFGKHTNGGARACWFSRSARFAACGGRGREGMRGHLALRQEGSPPSCTTGFSVMTGKATSPEGEAQCSEPTKPTRTRRAVFVVPL